MNQNCIIKWTSIVIIALVFSISCMAQNWPWVVQIGGYSHDEGFGKCDKDGNFYLTGVFRGNTCIFPDTSLSNSVHQAFFLSKFDNQGNMKWVKKLGQSYSEEFSASVIDILIENDGFVYITGKFYNNAHFDTIVLHSVSNTGDLFLAKFSPEGSCIWAKAAGGTGEDDGTAIAIDSLKNIYIAGECGRDAVFDTLNVQKGGFIAKCDSSGNWLYVKNECGYLWFSAEYTVLAMTIQENSIYASGYSHNDTINVDTIFIAHPGKKANLLLCFDLNANIKWLKLGVSVNAFSGQNITRDDEGNLFVSGMFMDSIDFDGHVLANPGKTDAFFCKYDKNGNLLWARQAMATQEAWGSSIVADNAGNSYASGYFEGSAFPALGFLTSDDYKDAFLIKYDPDGNAEGIKHFGYGEGSQVGLDKDSNPYLVGWFEGEIALDNTILTSYGLNDIFLCRSDKISGAWEHEKSPYDNLEIYANPTTGKCNITIPDVFINEKSLTLTIYDNQGKEVFSTTFNLSEDKIRLNLSAYANGIYTALLTNGKKSYTGRIVFAGK